MLTLKRNSKRATKRSLWIATFVAATACARSQGTFSLPPRGIFPFQIYTCIIALKGDARRRLHPANESGSLAMFVGYRPPHAARL